jgi:hypothetical protein
VLQGSAQFLLRTTSGVDFSAISLDDNFTNTRFGERMNIDESMYYRNRYNGRDKEKTIYNIFSAYKRSEVIGMCPYGMDIDLMSEQSEKRKLNTFRYWNKIRLGFKFLIETNPKYSAESILDYIDGEICFSYLHLPHDARGDQTTKARKGSFMMFIMATPSERGIAYMKYNVGSTWIKVYYRKEKRNLHELEDAAGITAEVEVNRNGYNRSLVQSSRDIYRGWTLFGGPEYNMKLSRIFLNVGILITTENH